MVVVVCCRVVGVLKVFLFVVVLLFGIWLIDLGGQCDVCWLMCVLVYVVILVDCVLSVIDWSVVVCWLINLAVVWWLIDWLVGELFWFVGLVLVDVFGWLFGFGLMNGCLV